MAPEDSGQRGGQGAALHPSGIRSRGRPQTEEQVNRQALRELFPGVADLRAQAGRSWRHDVLVGVSVAAVAIPSSLGMADLAHLPPTAGLYGTMFPLAAYVLLGSSRILVAGPDGALSSMTGSTITPLAASATVYPAYAATLALLVGGVMTVASLLRLGFMADFLSKPILIGYTNGIALTIIVGQLGKLLGIPTRNTKFFPQIWEILTNLGRASLVTTALSAALLGGILLLRHFVPRLPAALIAVVAATAASAALDLAAHGVAVVGHVASGLPVPRFPHVPVTALTPLLLAAVGMALVSFGDVMAITRGYAVRGGYEIRAPRELAGLGLANLVAGLTRSQPVSSSGSRTAVAAASGARTQIVSLTVAALAVVVALAATPLLTDLPKAALGVVLVIAALGMLNPQRAWRLRRVHNSEAFLAATTTVAVLAFGILGGLLIAIALSIGVFVQRTVRPHDAVLGAADDVDGWHDVSHLHGAQTVPGLVVYRFDAPLFFPNAPYFKARVRETLGEADGHDPAVRFLLVNAEAVSNVDATAVATLREVRRELADAGITLGFARVKWHIRKVFDAAGLTGEVGVENIFPTVRTGVAEFEARLRAGGSAEPTRPAGSADSEGSAEAGD
jgi:SulP family sulfate permease